jgi:hypothetical protein
MSSHIKKVQKPIRFTVDEWRDAKRAARLLARERGERVTPSALVRDIGMAGIRAELTRLDAPASVAAA